MQDRVSLYPGRVKLEPVAGQANTYDLTRADQPTQEGTPLNKASLLSDATETAMFGASANRTVDEAFAGLAAQIKLIMSNTADITLTLKDSAGHALPGVLVQGILTESGQAVYSGTDGIAAGYIAEGSQTIKVTGYADIEDYTETIAVTKGTTITKTLTLTTRNFLKITSSRSVKFSSNVQSVDVSVGSGGGGAATTGWHNDYGGGGGGGGHTNKQTGIAVEANTQYPAIIGAGGTTPLEDGGAGSEGGKSSFLGVTADGGKGGTEGIGSSAGGKGNGNGGYPTGSRTTVDGTNGTETVYSSFTEEYTYGGGGAGVANGDDYEYATYSKPGKPGGGKHWGKGTDGLGGGGGAGDRAASSKNYGKGGSGVITIRMHLKSAA